MTEHERSFLETFANLLVMVALRASARTTPPSPTQTQPEQPARAEDPPRDPESARKT